MIASTWEALPVESKTALLFAWAAAQQRAADASPNTAVDAFDLLIGIILSRPGESEAERTFRHFDLVAGQVLPAGYPALTFDTLQESLAAMTTTGVPPTMPEVDQILELGSSIAPRDSGADTGLAALWLAMLQVGSPARTQIYDLLERRGINSSLLIDSMTSWLTANDGDFQSVLAKFSATPVDIVNYKADQSGFSDSSGIPASLEDYIGVAAEVDAFAYLLASRNLSPPLAIGLFGDWGSGKSFFLDAIRRRIDTLTRTEVERGRAQTATRFWKHIVQVEFNAWHYVEGDLLSSLVDHIFSQMNLASDKGSDDIVLERQRHLLGQLESTAATVKQLDDRKKKLESTVSKQQEVVAARINDKDVALARLERARTNLVAVELVETKVAAALTALGAVKVGAHDQSPETLGEQAEALRSARDDLNRGSALFRPYVKHPAWLILVLLLLCGTPFVALAVEQWSHSSAAAALSGFASLLAVYSGAIGVGSSWVHRRLDELAAAQVKVDKKIVEEKKRLEDEVSDAQRELAQATQELQRAEREHTELSGQLDSIKRDLDKKPQQVLNDFLRERLAAGDYSKRLGVPAIIRRDFKDLAKLIGYQNAYLTAQSGQRKQEIRAAADNRVLEDDDPLIVNRIILYIDDLDRCPDAKVIEVLQAVHMLLAFPLFVVVVAVDARWLASALQNRYPALAGVGYALDGRPVRPNDYLEKIFQVPFWVSHLTDGARAAIVRGLLGPHVRGSAALTSVGEQDPAQAVSDLTAKALHEMVNTRTAPPQLDIAALQLTADELAFLERLTPMLGDTPRSVKRFVNIYQLLKILRRGRSQVTLDPPDELVAALLLAMSERLPLLFKSIGNGQPLSLSQLADDSRQIAPGEDTLSIGEERRCLAAWLATQQPAWNLVDGIRLSEIAGDVRRFLFQRFEVEASEAQARQPWLVHVIQES